MPATIPAQCRPIQREIDALKAERASLQAALQHASTPQKPALASEIKGLGRMISKKNTELSSCVARNSA